jgi:hypothetical protein
MPSFIKFLWVIALLGMSIIVYSLKYADRISELEDIKKVSGTIGSVSCKEGSRSFMQKKLVFITDDSLFKFTRDGECPQLLALYGKANEFEATQMTSLLSTHTLSLKVDGVEQFDFNQQIYNYNLYVILSPFIVPLFLAFVATLNWLRGRWRV